VQRQTERQKHNKHYIQTQYSITVTVITRQKRREITALDEASSRRCFRGPMAANAVMLASRCRISSISASWSYTHVHINTIRSMCTDREGAHPLWSLSRQQLDPIKLACVSPYASSPGRRAHWYAELAVSSPAVAENIVVIALTHGGWPGRVARITRRYTDSTHCAYPRRDTQAEWAWINIEMAMVSYSCEIERDNLILKHFSLKMTDSFTYNTTTIILQCRIGCKINNMQHASV